MACCHGPLLASNSCSPLLPAVALQCSSMSRASGVRLRAASAGSEEVLGVRAVPAVELG